MVQGFKISQQIYSAVDVTHRINLSSRSILSGVSDRLQHVRTYGPCSPYDGELKPEDLPAQEQAHRVKSNDEPPHQNITVRALSVVGCPEPCHCQCHTSKKIESPNWLRPILGSLSIGYRNTPWVQSPCDDPHCALRAKQATLVYTFPAWFVHSIVYATFRSSGMEGPELTIRVMNLRDEKSWEAWNFFAYGRHDSIESELRRQLYDGETSVLDVTSTGQTLLHVIRRSPYHSVSYKG